MRRFYETLFIRHTLSMHSFSAVVYFDYVNACRLLASHLLRFSHLEDLLSFQYLSFLINMQADFADFHRNMIKKSALKPCLLS